MNILTAFIICFLSVVGLAVLSVFSDNTTANGRDNESRPGICPYCGGPILPGGKRHKMKFEEVCEWYERVREAEMHIGDRERKNLKFEEACEWYERISRQVYLAREKVIEARSDMNAARRAALELYEKIATTNTMDRGEHQYVLNMRNGLADVLEIEVNRDEL